MAALRAHLLYGVLLGGLVTVLFWGCEDDLSSVAVDIQDDTPLGTFVLDTFSVSASTVLLDSLVTSTATHILVGNHRDERLGHIAALGYFQPGISSLPGVSEDDTFDSLTLILNYSYYYYDTAEAVTIYIHRVVEEIEPADDGSLYNNMHFAYDPVPLGAFTFEPRPRREDSVEIRLSDALGQELFDLVQNDAEEVENNQEFLDYFKGLVLVPGEDSAGAILGFGLESEMVLYYALEQELPAKGSERMRFGNVTGNFHFNQIITDREGTPLNSLLRQREALRSQETNEETFMQSGAGLMCRIDFPSIRDIRELGDRYAINAAYLDIYPVKNSYDGLTFLPQTFDVLIANGINEPVNTLPTNITLLIDDEFGENTFYRLQLTDYILNLVETDERSDDGLMLSIPASELQSTVNRVHLRDHRNDDGMRLVVFMTVFDDQ